MRFVPVSIACRTVAALIAGLAAAMPAKSACAEARKLDMDVSPLDGEAVAKLVRDLASTPPAVVERFKTISEAR